MTAATAGTEPEPRCWAVVPAAGAGRRMGGELPKQYLSLGGRTVLAHTLESLFADARIQGVVVAVREGDQRFGAYSAPPGRTLLPAAGGAERCDSVLSALQVLSARAGPRQWVLVHDAARPCLGRADLGALIDTLADDPVGGLLAVPACDTMKRAAPDGTVACTVDRAGLWHALTPQMFRLGALIEALRRARAAGLAVTDEASAMEAAGWRPRLVEGHSDNIKITRPGDLPLAEFHLRAQERL